MNFKDSGEGLWGLGFFAISFCLITCCSCRGFCCRVCMLLCISLLALAYANPQKLRPTGLEISAFVSHSICVPPPPFRSTNPGPCRRTLSSWVKHQLFSLILFQQLPFFDPHVLTCWWPAIWWYIELAAKRVWLTSWLLIIP